MQVSSAPYVMCVHPEFPANDGPGLIAELKKNPDKYTYGNDGARRTRPPREPRGSFARTGTSARTCRSKVPARRCKTFSAGTSTSTSDRSRRSCQHLQQEPREVPARHVGRSDCRAAEGVGAARPRHPERGNDPVARADRAEGHAARAHREARERIRAGRELDRGAQVPGGRGRAGRDQERRGAARLHHPRVRGDGGGCEVAEAVAAVASTHVRRSPAGCPASVRRRQCPRLAQEASARSHLPR